jgi:hypothetical protein
MATTKETLFPHKNRGFALAASDEPVLLNGMRVLFDEKVALYPVELEPDSSRKNLEKENKNGLRTS